LKILLRAFRLRGHEIGTPETIFRRIYEYLDEVRDAGAQDTAISRHALCNDRQHIVRHEASVLEPSDSAGCFFNRATFVEAMGHDAAPFDV